MTPRSVELDVSASSKKVIKTAGFSRSGVGRVLLLHQHLLRPWPVRWAQRGRRIRRPGLVRRPLRPDRVTGLLMRIAATCWLATLADVVHAVRRSSSECGLNPTATDSSGSLLSSGPTSSGPQPTPSSSSRALPERATTLAMSSRSNREPMKGKFSGQSSETQAFGYEPDSR